MSQPHPTITIDGHPVAIAAGDTLLDAARKLGLDIPTLCHVQQCGPLNTCQVCLVKLNGKLVPSCGTLAEPGMAVRSETEEVHEARRTALELLFSDHVGDCLAPCHRLCPLGLNIPLMLRQLQNNQPVEAAATVREALPLAAVLGRLCHHPCEQGCRRGAWDSAANIRDLERYIADTDLERQSASSHSASPTPHSALKVALIGTGPAGLAAAHYLLRSGYACTLFDRHAEPGGSLRRQTDEQLLPRKVLDAEIEQLRQFGAEFRLKVSVGADVTLDALRQEFNAVLIAVGEVSKPEGDALGLETAPGGIKVQAETCQTSQPGVFAAGRAVKPMTHLVRAMTEGKAAAECIHRFLSGQELKRAGKPISSIMGRLMEGELERLVQAGSPETASTPCATCACATQAQAATQAARCLHCDCRSSGNCALQYYAQVYSADAGRYRQGRRFFEQQAQPGGVLFEPGKCIRCGICVKITEQAGEPLGLSFIGRGFNVRLAAPFNRGIEEGLQRTAEECVRHCPTGALVFREKPRPETL
jgi:ferredoxin